MPDTLPHTSSADTPTGLPNTGEGSERSINWWSITSMLAIAIARCWRCGRGVAEASRIPERSEPPASTACGSRRPTTAYARDASPTIRTTHLPPSNMPGVRLMRIIEGLCLSHLASHAGHSRARRHLSTDARAESDVGKLWQRRRRFSAVAVRNGLVQHPTGYPTYLLLLRVFLLWLL